MSKLKKTSEIVKQVLQEIPATRNSDDLLYVHVCNRINPEVCNYPFHTVLIHRKELKLPPFESVRRTRQKVQQHFPELAASETIEGFRVVREEEYRDYARSVSV